jgi:serine/threonine-protein kinase
MAPELRQQITRRLRITALIYSSAFFFADLVPTFIFGHLFERLQHPRMWVPTVGSILAGLAIAAISSSSRLSWQSKLNLGLAFGVAGSYGIALAQYLDISAVRDQPLVLQVLSPSWVAIWMIVYSIVVPATPAKTLAALIASASAPPVVIMSSLSSRGLGYLMPTSLLLVQHVLPYLICVMMAFVGARVVYNLGKDVTRARELGSYRLVERLGSGGMGEVWKATHQLLARPAAIKFIRPETISGVRAGEARLVSKRFELEARATASLTSAHTIDLYDFGVTEDNSFYYVMELLDGLDCDALVTRAGALPPARVIHLLTQMCESLDEAHTRGLIHRDVKPANIYVCRSGNRFDFVKVLDFGLVTDHREQHMETKLTLPHQAVGTPQFMPPEMALGKNVDGRTDLYALGCVAFWLSTGRHVFGGENSYDIVSKHLHVLPEPPSRYAAKGFPPELDAVILACLEKDPDRRPSNARELARRLRAIPLTERWGDEEAEAWWREAQLVQA